MIYFVFLPTQAPSFYLRKFKRRAFQFLLRQSTPQLPMMQTRRYRKSTANVHICGTSPPGIDINHPASPIDDSTSTHATAEHDQPQSTSSLGDLETSPSTHSIPPTRLLSRSATPTANITSLSGSSSAIPTTPIERPFGLHPQGRDAFASFPNNITNINPADYTWVKGSSNYTLCHKTLEEPIQALLWFVGDIDRHSLDTATAYENWTVDILLPAETDKALDSLLKLVHGRSLLYRIATPYSELRQR